MKRKLTLFAVVTGLAVFSLVSVAAASAGGFGGGSSEHLDRVAEILGISPDELSNAMDQARSEARAERLEERLTTAVEDEVLTQEEADAIRDWFNGKPEALENLSHSQRHELRHALRDETLAEFLTGLVADEILTQAESDEIATWFDAKPTEALEKIRPEFGPGGHRGFGGGFGLGHGGRFGGKHRGFGYGFPPPVAPDAEPTTESSESTNTSIVYY